MWKVAGTKVPRSCSANIQFHVCPLCLLFVLTAFNWHDDLSGLQFCSLSSTRNLSAYHCAPKDWQNEWMSMRCEGVRVCVSEWERQRRRVCIREERKRGWDIEWMNIVCVHVNGSREQNRDMEAKWTLNICPPPTDWRGDEIWKSPQLLFFFAYWFWLTITICLLHQWKCELLLEAKHLFMSSTHVQQSDCYLGKCWTEWTRFSSP